MIVFLGNSGKLPETAGWAEATFYFETCKVGVTCFPLLMSTFNGFSKFTKVMSGRVRTNNSIL